MKVDPSGLASTQEYTIYVRASLSDINYLDKELTFTAEAEEETCVAQTLAHVSQEAWLESAVIGTAEITVSNLQDLFYSNTPTTMITSTLKYEGKRCSSGHVFVETDGSEASYTQEQCASFSLSEPLCAGSEGWYAFRAETGKC